MFRFSSEKLPTKDLIILLSNGSLSLVEVDETNEDEITSLLNAPNLRQKESVQKDDLLLIVQGRKQTVSYNPTMDKIPGLLSRAFQDTSVVILYPSISWNQIHWTDIAGM